MEPRGKKPPHPARVRSPPDLRPDLPLDDLRPDLPLDEDEEAVSEPAFRAALPDGEGGGGVRKSPRTLPIAGGGGGLGGGHAPGSRGRVERGKGSEKEQGEVKRTKRAKRER